MPLTAVFSGPLATREIATAALGEVGFSIDERHGDHHWGHPSYRNPGEAARAGKPNAGHTPGTGHGGARAHGVGRALALAQGAGRAHP